MGEVRGFDERHKCGFIIVDVGRPSNLLEGRGWQRPRIRFGSMLQNTAPSGWDSGRQEAADVLSSTEGKEELKLWKGRR